MRWLLMIMAFGIFAYGCAVYELPQDVMMTFKSGKTMEVKAIERVGLFGQDWFIGGAELCDPALEGMCVVQIFHGHGGSLANSAVYGLAGSALLAPAIRDSGTEVNQNQSFDNQIWQNLSNDFNLSLKQEQAQFQKQQQKQRQQQTTTMPTMPVMGGPRD